MFLIIGKTLVNKEIYTIMNKKIITVTFCPAIDKSTTVQALIPEKKLNCTNPVYEPGGGGINVARVIKRLGDSAMAIYLAGGQSGKLFTKMLTDEDIDVIAIKTQAITRENFIVKELSTNKQYRFGIPGARISEKEWQNCLTAIEQLNDIAYIVVSGSLPPGIPADIFAKIAETARAKKTKLIVDTSGDALFEAAKAGVYLIKPNLKELGYLVKNEHLSIDQAEEAAKAVINKFKCEIVITSLGPDGALLVTQTTTLKITPPAVNVLSTVGAGDSMVAGIVFSLAREKSVIASAQYGVACGTAATLNPGTELCHLNDAEYLYRLIQNNDDQYVSYEKHHI